MAKGMAEKTVDEEKGMLYDEDVSVKSTLVWRNWQTQGT